jgi:hypothetical protein
MDNWAYQDMHIYPYDTSSVMTDVDQWKGHVRPGGVFLLLLAARGCQRAVQCGVVPAASSQAAGT